MRSFARLPPMAFVCALVALSPVTTSADWVGPSLAAATPTVMEVRIDEGQVEVDLEIDPSDLEHFRDLLDADRFEAAFGADREGESVRRRRFFATTGLRIHVEGSESPVAGRVLQLEERDRVARELPAEADAETLARRDPRVLFVRLAYPLEGQPDSIRLAPPPVDGLELARVNVGFLTLHLGMPIHGFRYLGRVETLRLDWQDAWYSRYENRNLRRHHLSPVLDYLYVGDFEVRHEVLIRVRDLSPWLTPEVADSTVIAPEERDAVAAQVAALLASRGSLRVDGRQVEPSLDRVDYIDVGLRGITVDRSDAPVPMSRATVGVIFSHPVEGIPDEVSLDWDLFSETIAEVPAFTVDPFVKFPTKLTPDAPTLSWANRLPNYRGALVEPTEVERAPALVEIPLRASLAILLGFFLLLALFRRRLGGIGKRGLALSTIIGVALVAFGASPGPTLEVEHPFRSATAADPERAEELLSRVLTNVYRAFEAREDGDVYDRLAVSVVGSPLQVIFLEQRRAFAMEQQGGAVARVDRVEVLDVDDVDMIEGDLRMRARWLASGTVGHWGHTHRRTNQYQALLTLSPSDGVWKLNSFEVEELERIR